MFCGQCGTNNAPGIHFCGNCGARMFETAAPAPVAQAPVPAPPPANVAPAPMAPPPSQPMPPANYGGAGYPADEPARRTGTLSIDFRRLGTADWVALGATILLLVSLFLSWYSATGEDDADVIITVKENVFGQFAGGFRVLVLVTCILVILYLFVRTMTPRGLRLPLPHWQVLTILTTLQAILTVLTFFLKPGAGTGIPVSWQYGAYIGLPAAVIAAVASAMRSREPEIIVPGTPRAGFGAGYGGGSPGYGGPSYGPPGYGSPVPPQQVAPQQVAPPPVAVTQCAQCGAAVQVGTPYCSNCGTPTGR
jgi:hypothetical protein